MKGNDRIGLMKLFLAFFTKSLQKHYKALPTDGPTDEPTDGPTDRRTDRPSYRDARTHLKTAKLYDVAFSRTFFINRPILLIITHFLDSKEDMSLDKLKYQLGT